MADMDDFNQQIVEEFRANAGKVGGPFFFAEYEKKTDRPIPVIVLERVS